MFFTLLIKNRPKVNLNLLRLGLIDMSNQSGKNYSIDIGGMRVKYKLKEEVFTENDLVSKEPIGQFKKWFNEACLTDGILEANAMCLSTCTRDGIPSSRYVLLKGYGTDGFKFFTNYTSRKAKELDENPRAALLFYWEPLKRSVRIEGTVEKVPVSESDEYFHSRPKDSQIGALLSNQSQPVEGRSILTDKETELKQKYAGDNIIIPRPNWGGYIVKHHSVEFWQGQSDRLHDRIRFRRLAPNETVDGALLHQGDDDWVYERLQP